VPKYAANPEPAHRISSSPIPLPAPAMNSAGPFPPPSPPPSRFPICNLQFAIFNRPHPPPRRPPASGFRLPARRSARVGARPARPPMRVDHRARASDKVGRAPSGAILECGGKRSATPLWLGPRLAFPHVPGGPNPASAGRFALPAHSQNPLRQPPWSLRQSPGEFAFLQAWTC